MPRPCWRLCLILLLSCITGLAQAAPAWGLPQLMESLAAQSGGQTGFVEKKYLAVLERPLESSGLLVYSPPDRLEKITLKPKPESMVLVGDTLTLERGKQKHSIALSSYPEVAAFIASIRGTLAGDRTALEQHYGLHLEGQPGQWTLTLLPKDTRMAELVLKIRIQGSQAQLRSVEIFQADGDRSLMLIQKPAP